MALSPYVSAPQSSEYTSKFVPLPLDFLQGQLDKKQQSYDVAKSAIEKVKDELIFKGGMQTKLEAKDLTQEYMPKVDSIANELATQANPTAAILKLSNLQRTVQQDPRVQIVKKDEVLEPHLNTMMLDEKYQKAAKPWIVNGAPRQRSSKNGTLAGDPSQWYNIEPEETFRESFKDVAASMQPEIIKKNGEEVGVQYEDGVDTQGRPIKKSYLVTKGETIKELTRKVMKERTDPYFQNGNYEEKQNIKYRKALGENIDPTKVQGQFLNEFAPGAYSYSEESQKMSPINGSGAGKSSGSGSSKQPENPDMNYVTVGYVPKIMQSAYVSTLNKEQLKTSVEFKQAFTELDPIMKDPQKLVEHLIKNAGGDDFVNPEDVKFSLDSQGGIIPNVDITAESIATNKLKREGNANPTSDEIRLEASRIPKDLVYKYDSMVDASINEYNTYKDVTTSANQVLYSKLSDKDKEVYDVVYGNRNLETTSMYPKVQENFLRMLTSPRTYSLTDTEQEILHSLPAFKGDRDAILKEISTNPKWQQDFNQFATSELSGTKKQIDKLEESSFNDYYKNLIDKKADQAPVVRFSTPDEPNNRIKTNTIDYYEQGLRDKVAPNKKMISEGQGNAGMPMLDPVNAQVLRTLEDVRVVYNNETKGKGLYGSTTVAQRTLGEKIDPTQAFKEGGDYVGIDYQGMMFADGKWVATGTLRGKDGSSGDLVTFNIPGDNTTKEVYNRIGVGDVSGAIKTVDYLLDINKNNYSGEGVVPGVKTDIFRGKGIDGKTYYSVKYDIPQAKLGVLNAQLKEMPGFTENDVIRPSDFGVVKNYSDKVSMALDMQKTSKLFNVVENSNIKSLSTLNFPNLVVDKQVSSPYINTDVSENIGKLTTDFPGLRATSAYRRVSKNKEVGGVSSSKHLQGKALDFHPSDESKKLLSIPKEDYPKYGIEDIIDEKDHIHVEFV